ncbi:transketolase family protein [Patescibacteria group bacterium]
MNNFKNFKQSQLKSCRDAYGQALVKLANNNKNIVALTANLAESTRLLDFSKKYPERFFEVGVAEQNMAGIAAGLALEGKIPFCSSFAVFSPGRNWEQIKISVCYNNANVKIVSTHAGLSVGQDGATHQGMEDIALMRVLPNMTVISPCDYIETEKAIIAAVKTKGPVYIRLPRGKSPVFTTNKTGFKIGKAEIFKEGKDVTIIGCGPLVYEALKAASELKKNKIEAEVINCHTIKLIDTKTIIESAKKTGKVVTIEDHQIHGGLGGAVAEALSQNYPVPVEIIGMPDSFGESGEPQELLDKYKINSQEIINRVNKLLK